MSELEQHVAAQTAVNEALSGQGYTGEPFFAQIDNMILQTIQDFCLETEQQLNKVTGEYEEVILEIKYPEIFNTLLQLTHLDRTTYYTPDQADISWFNSRHIYRKLRAKHRRDDEALNMIDLIESLRYTIVYGDAERGMRQDFVAKVSGATKQISVGAGQSKGIWDRILGGA